MNKPLERWEVLPHGKLTEVDENILTVTGEIHMPMKFPRRMTVVRLRDSNLVVFSAIALDEFLANRFGRVYCMEELSKAA